MPSSNILFFYFLPTNILEKKVNNGFALAKQNILNIGLVVKGQSQGSGIGKLTESNAVIKALIVKPPDVRDAYIGLRVEVD